jgi:NADH:ubiquinone oxidoreductase subunit F (NADH-binding)/NADH:ubiquinone oxidoreductase subunit E
MIISELRRIQEQFGYLAKPELEALSKKLSEPLHRLHEVITFFPHFRLAPPPAAAVKVCRDMACHLGGAVTCHAALKAVADEFGVAVRSTVTAVPGVGNPLHPRVEIGWVSCLGRCDGAAAVMVELHAVNKPDQLRILTRDDQQDYASRLRAMLGAHLVGAEIASDPVDRSPLPWRINPYQTEIANLTDDEPYAAARRLAESLRNARDDADRNVVGDSLLATLQTSDLRGMGGAGRPAFSKWAEVRDESKRADATYLICNGDESEPSTFKDREILLRAPHLVIEGMVLGALLVAARKGYIYVRHEYHDQVHAVAKAIERAREKKIIGPDVLGTGHPFELEVFESPGGYVCGEQSALIEAIEEHRAEPRNRPPAIEANGLYGKPTLLNNVETFAWVPAILLNGGEWYRDSGLQGTPWYTQRGKTGGRGVRLFSICGDVCRPGVFEVPVGTTLGELIDLAGGTRDGLPLLALAPSGPSGAFLPAVLRPADLPLKKRKNFPADRSELDIRDVPLDKVEYDDLGFMLGAGLLVVADAPERSMLDLALNATRFFRNESCGKCVPCRVGSEKLVKIGERLAAKPGPQEHDQLMALVGELQSVMEQTSICGLGTSASKPLASLFEHEWNGTARMRT